MELAEAFGLLRLAELREDIRNDLDAACYWEVTADGRGMYVRVGPHRLDIPASHPVFGRVDLVLAGLVDGKVAPVLLAGTPHGSPVPPRAYDGQGLPLAWVNVHALTYTLYPYNISEVR